MTNKTHNGFRLRGGVKLLLIAKLRTVSPLNLHHNQKRAGTFSEHHPYSNRREIKESNAIVTNLGLIPADPDVGLSAFEATGGIHPSRICVAAYLPLMDTLRDQYFCDIRDKPIPWTSLPPPLMTPQALNSPKGVFMPCPETKEGCYSLETTTAGLEACLAYCGGNLFRTQEGGFCSETDDCDFRTFCRKLPGNATGICSKCPSNPREDCLVESDAKSCLQCHVQCSLHYWGDFTVEDQAVWTSVFSTNQPLTNDEMIAPLVDCSDEEVETCANAKDSICLIKTNFSYTTVFAQAPNLFHRIGLKSQNSGCLAVVIFHSQEEIYPDNRPGVSWIQSTLDIPAIIVSYASGSYLLESKLGSIANLTVYNNDLDQYHQPLAEEVPGFCRKNEYCSFSVDCVDENEYCLPNSVLKGFRCTACPEDPLECFFPKFDAKKFVNTELMACSSKCAYR
jgi:hypothetical protein